MDSPYYVLAEVAKLFRISERTVYNWMASGKLHPVRVGRGRWLFPRDEVDGLLKR
jgi:excisionase family DNA binding protein